MSKAMAANNRHYHNSTVSTRTLPEDSISSL